MKLGWETSTLGEVLAVLRNGVNCKQDKSGQGDRISRIESISDASFDLEKVGYATLSDCEKERYRLQHSRWPAALADLVPDLLPGVPADPFDGQPLRYRRLADGVAVYSVGDDRADGGASLADGFPPPAGTDVGVRLWDVPRRRQSRPEAPP